MTLAFVESTLKDAPGETPKRKGKEIEIRRSAMTSIEERLIPVAN